MYSSPTHSPCLSPEDKNISSSKLAKNKEIEKYEKTEIITTNDCVLVVFVKFLNSRSCRDCRVSSWSERCCTRVQLHRSRLSRRDGNCFLVACYLKGVYMLNRSLQSNMRGLQFHGTDNTIFPRVGRTHYG